MKTLRISDDLALPLDAVTEKLAWLGRTGSGKTYAAMKLAELMLGAGAQVGALDPVGVWRGLRVPTPECPRAFDVVVFGGLSGDLPLEPTAGELIADLVCDRALSFVLDISQFIPAEQQRFVRAFADRFFHRKKSSPSAVHLFMEECQEFIAENPSGEEAKTLGVMQRLWKLGRNFGIGGSLISQRPQEIAKKALNMSGTLFAFQMTGSQERAAVKKWVQNHDVAADIESVLQRLNRGEPHVELFLETQEGKVFRHSGVVRILARVTADLSSTPKVGGSAAARRPLTPIDVEQLKTAMAATIEKAKADDPRELRKTIGELRAELKKAQAAKPAAVPKAVPAPKPAPSLVKAEHVKRIEAAVARLDSTMGAFLKEHAHQVDQLAQRQQVVVTELGLLRTALAQATAPPATGRGIEALIPTSSSTREGRATGTAVAQAHAQPPRRPPAVARPHVSSNGDLSGPEQRILDALAWLESIGNTTPPQTAVAFLAGYGSTEGGAYCNPRGRLSVKGLVNYRGGQLTLTDAGRQHARYPDEALTADEMQSRVLARLGGPETRILTPLLKAYPDSLTNEELAEAAGYGSAEGGAFCNPRGRLSSLGLIEYRSGVAKAKPFLFLEGR